MIALTKLTASTGGDGRGFFNVAAAPYSASPGNTAAANTIAFNKAIADALPTSGTVYIAPGTYLLNTVSWDPRVSLQGAGVTSTTLQSVAAEPLISYAGTTMIYNPAGPEISHLKFDGASIGTVGLQIRAFAYYNFHHLYFTNLVRGADTQGVILGEWSHVQFNTCTNGWRSLYTTNTSLGVMQSNLNIMKQCQFQSIPGRSIELEKAASLQLRYCDFERTGTAGVDQSGAILLRDMAPANEGVNLLMDGCWFEVNQGTLIDLLTPLGNTRTIIQNSLIQQYSGGAGIGLRVGGGGTFLNKVLLSGTTISGFPKDITSSGASAIVEVISSTVGIHEELNGATYAVFNPVNAALTPIAGGMGASDVSYLAAVTADAPIYFNDMAEAATFATPRIGTVPITLRTAGSYAGYNGGAFTNRRTGKFDGGTSGADLALNLSAYVEVGFEFLYLLEDATLNYSGVLGLAAGWTAVPGGFRVATHAPGPNATSILYAGTRGDVGLNEKHVAPAPTIGWKHIYVQINTRTGISRLTINNVINPFIIDTTTGSNTNLFYNGVLGIMGSPGNTTEGERGRMSHLAIYAGTLPTDARIAAHYAAISQ